MKEPAHVQHRSTPLIDKLFPPRYKCAARFAAAVCAAATVVEGDDPYIVCGQLDPDGGADRRRLLLLALEGRDCKYDCGRPGLCARQCGRAARCRPAAPGRAY